MIVKLNEESIRDWRRNGLSWRNKEFYAIRKKHHNEARLINTMFTDTGDLVLIWKITPTYGGGQKAVKAYDLTGKAMEVKYYTMEIMFEDVFDEFMDWNELEFNKKRVMILNILENWENTKFHCNDPSFLGQGAWKRLDDRKSAIYKFPPFTDSGLWASRHGQNRYLTKHFVNMFEVVKFNTTDIVKQIDTVIGDMESYDYDR